MEVRASSGSRLFNISASGPLVWGRGIEPLLRCSRPTELDDLRPHRLRRSAHPYRAHSTARFTVHVQRQACFHVNLHLGDGELCMVRCPRCGGENQPPNRLAGRAGSINLACCARSASTRSSGVSDSFRNSRILRVRRSRLLGGSEPCLLK